MSLDLSVFGSTQEVELEQIRELRSALEGLGEIRVRGSQDPEMGHVLFVQRSKKSPSFLEGLKKNGSRRGRSVFLVCEDSSEIPEELIGGLVDDVIVYPFRKLEVLSKLRHYQELMAWDEVEKMNTSFSELIAQFKDDFKLAERLQKANLPLRFPDIRGMKVTSRYLAGMKSGGDHFDLAESKDSNQLSMFLTDSSSYGLSSAVLSALMKIAMKLSVEESRSSSETVRRIQEELKATLTEKDKLSLFYGILSRRDYRLRYLNLGSSAGFYAPKDGKFAQLKSHAGAITSQTTEIPFEESELTLEPAGRFALISDGFSDAVGGAARVCELLDRFREKDPKDFLNEMVFHVKKDFNLEDDMPAQDCTGVIFDLDQRLIRLA